MINTNIFFEFMPMILKNHMFKIYLSRYFFNANRIFYNIMGSLNKQNKLQVDEILIFKTFLVNGHLKFTYVHPPSKVKVE
jgi:hypothetical protein